MTSLVNFWEILGNSAACAKTGCLYGSSLVVNLDSLLYCFLYNTHVWPNVNCIHQFPEDAPQYPAFLCFGHRVPFALLSIYIHLCLLSIFSPVSTKISCIFQSLSHTPSLPWSPSWPHLSNHRHDTFTASNVPRILCIFLRPTSQDWIYSQCICGVILLTYFAQLLSHSDQPSWFAKDWTVNFQW